MHDNFPMLCFAHPNLLHMSAARIPGKEDESSASIKVSWKMDKTSNLTTRASCSVKLKGFNLSFPWIAVKVSEPTVFSSPESIHWPAPPVPTKGP
uniref:Uncharacterized protein LOC107262686 isoform X1 n=1 Tax=Rhizophora mucronata TaxID=61149 RepID=A0A2P2MAF2_RHIMU